MMFEDLNELRSNYPVFQLTGTLLVLGISLMIKLIFGKIIRNRLEAQNFDPARAIYVRKITSFLIVTLAMVLLGVVWEISFKGLSVYIASIFTVIGVGLFANWSILSNITASVILFFFFPLRIGSKVRIVDGANFIEGEVMNLSLFSIRIRQEDGQIIYCPNNMVIQRYVVHRDVAEAEG
ncbi:MAG: mechanosensitive ion channel domain-containing protein [Bacteroidota bacterium]